MYQAKQLRKRGPRFIRTYFFSVANPLLEDLYRHITPRYAADWIVIGTLLGLPSGELKAIAAGDPTNVKRCCNLMFKKWLETDSTASWDKLLTVLELPAVSGSAPDKGDYVCIVYVQ